jgi:hypothetical protein
MMPSIAVIRKTPKKNRSRGRPRTGIGANVGLRLYPEQEARVDAWIDAQKEPELRRPEAIRRLIDLALAGKGKR